ncbi:sugar ABC transporter ATP-binding protein [Paenibacillus sp. GCM10027628]|uniref:sugar ABC transporter ATP-binding protein n=1 Tax=Paenibacillus sp. GCM10027628 TaxID=3273413 RepID=UPI0036387992
MSKEYILELDHISKQFPGVKALDNIQLKIRKGSVHALMGENGAGKSTLMKIIFGIYTPDSGTITFKGKEIKLSGSKDALSKGISMIHQELTPIPQMSVAENVFLGRELTGPTGLIDKKKMIEETRKLLNQLNIDIDPKTKMINLSIANIQMVEIAAAISHNADLIIMDEPTSAITDKEVDQLFEIINSLKQNGVSVIYISHKMDEIFRICDEITVFRDGQYVGTNLASETNQETLIRMMVGREIKQVFHKEEAEIGEVALSVTNLSRSGKFQNISFEVRKGEILGIAGLMGAGRTEVIESIFGIFPPDSGEIHVNGRKVAIKSPRDAIKHKIGLLTEDRKITGAFLPLTIRENMIVSSIDEFINKMGLLKENLIKEMCNLFVERLSIKTPSLDQKIENLSGGNQQKVLLARWLLSNPDILILDEPTRGVDVGAKSEIHKLMSRLAQTGKAIIMISSELPEVLGMSDRVMVMHEGKKKGELTRAEANQEKIMELAYS